MLQNSTGDQEVIVEGGQKETGSLQKRCGVQIWKKYITLIMRQRHFQNMKMYIRQWMRQTGITLSMPEGALMRLQEKLLKLSVGQDSRSWN